MTKTKITIIGAGAFGTALGNVIAYDNCEMMLYAIEEEVVTSINQQKINHKYLPNIVLTENITAVNSLNTAVTARDLIIITTPSQHIRKVVKSMDKSLIKAPIIIASKGLELPEAKFLSQVVLEEIPQAEMGILSGPSFASELVLNKPTILVLATKKLDNALELAEKLTRHNLRIYASTDIIGSQLGGVVKNVLAIACGITAGLNLGYNALCALLTRGLTETISLAEKLGGNKDTITGISGLGDLVLTATNKESRNFSFGFAIGELGAYSEELVSAKSGVREGYYNAQAIYMLAEKYAVEMPICREVYNILYEQKAVKESIISLLNRSLKAE